MLTPWNTIPSRPLDLADRMMDDIVRNFLQDEGAGNITQPASIGRMRMDVVEKPDMFQVFVDLPGVAKEGIDINIETNVGAPLLTVSASKELQPLDEGSWFLRQERRSGRFQRALRLPFNADTEHATTCFANGVLCLCFPKHTTPQGGFKKLALA